MTTEAYDEGRNAAFDGKEQHHNPHRPVNSKEYQQWLQGWRDGRAELGKSIGKSDTGGDVYKVKR